MKKIIPLCILSLFLFSCSFSSEKAEDSSKSLSGTSYKGLIEKTPKAIENNSEYNTCMAQAVDNCQKISFSQIVNTAKDTSRCQDFKTSELIHQCEDTMYKAQAVKDLDPNLCKKLSSGIEKCQEMVILEKANKEEKIDLCDGIASEKKGESENFLSRDMCKMGVINKKLTKGEKDKKLCAGLKTDTFINECNILMK